MPGSPSAAPRKAPRLAIIGLDGATWEIIQPMIEQGRLPAIKALMDEGLWGPLRSVIPSLTGPAWASILTGHEPGGHGVFDMTVPDPRRPGVERPVGPADCRATPIWDMLNEQGLTTGFLAVPFTYPPPRVNGWMVSGIMGTPVCDVSMCHPPSLFDGLVRVAGQCPLEVLIRDKSGFAFDRLDAHIGWIKRAALYLLEQHPVDVFMVVENYTDHVSHLMIKTRQAVRQGRTVDALEYAYEAADDLVASVRAAVGDDCPIILVSDHGSGAVTGHINLNAALGASTRSSPLGALVTETWRLVSHLLSRRFKQRLRKVIGSMPEFVRVTKYGDASLTVINNRIYVSARDEVTRERTIHHVIKQLQAVADPAEGRPLIRAVRGPELYGPPYGQSAADIVITPEDGMRATYLGDLPLLPTLDQVRNHRRKTTLPGLEGVHRQQGIFATSRKVALPDGSDRALPTSLLEVCGYCLRLCLGDNVDADAIINRPATGTGASGYTDEQQELVAARLADLGYL